VKGFSISSELGITLSPIVILGIALGFSSAVKDTLFHQFD
jgi:hypothetical protein